MIYFETSFPVRYYETDQMGIVHHSNYIRYFECSRTAMLKEIGYPVDQIEADGVVMPVVSVSCRYKHSARLGDTVKCVSIIEKLPLAKMTIVQKVYNQDDVLCADGSVIIGFLDKATGRPVPCPQKFLEILQANI
ncbi:MAG: thioesterase family protein [Bacteroidales bacterium]|nr:thioesterase family protein [Bacteroidales bacterium]